MTGLRKKDSWSWTAVVIGGKGIRVLHGNGKNITHFWKVE